MAIIQAIGFMFGHGAGSLISRKLGEKDHERIETEGRERRCVERYKKLKK